MGGVGTQRWGWGSYRWGWGRAEWGLGARIRGGVGEGSARVTLTDARRHPLRCHLAGQGALRVTTSCPRALQHWCGKMHLGPGVEGLGCSTAHLTLTPLQPWCLPAQQVRPSLASSPAPPPSRQRLRDNWEPEQPRGGCWAGQCCQASPVPAPRPSLPPSLSHSLPTGPSPLTLAETPLRLQGRGTPRADPVASVDGSVG